VSDPQPGSFAPEEVTAGGILAAARAERGLSVAEVAQRLKFSLRQIEALEADRYEALPGAPFVRGMVRSYAKLLEIDAAPLLGSIERSVVAGEVEMLPHDMSVPLPADRRPGSRVYVLLSMLIVLAVAVVLAEWFIRSQHTVAPVAVAPPVAEPLAPPGSAAPPPPAAEPAAAPEPPAAPPAPSAAAVPESPPVARTARASVSVNTPASAPASTPVPPGRGRVEFSCETESWVEIRDASGEVIFSALNAAGTRRVVQGAAPLTVVIGNASGVRLSFNSAPVNLAPYTRVDVARLTLE
jgi:cytoskeleton protein RodZ